MRNSCGDELLFVEFESSPRVEWIVAEKWPSKGVDISR